MLVSRLGLVYLLALFAPTANAVTCEGNLSASNPDSAYTVHGDGTATDTRTGLMWKVCSEGQSWNYGNCAGSASTHSWANALALAEGTVFAGHEDWRLPNLKELRSLVEECRAIPAINDSIFPSMPNSYFWSGSPYAFGSNSAWAVGSDHGDAEFFNRGSSYRVRLVRGGVSGTPPLAVLGVNLTSRPSLTVVIHGFGLVHTDSSSVWPLWPTELAKSVGARLSGIEGAHGVEQNNYGIEQVYGYGGDVPIYRLRLTNCGLLTNPCIDVSQTMPLPSTMAENVFTYDGQKKNSAVIVVDWTDLDGFEEIPTDTVARLTVDYLLSSKQGLMELPMHLIGHSRGGSAVLALAHYLAEKGFLVDQLTTIDPHPIPIDFQGRLNDLDADPITDPLLLPGNVIYADNYRQINDSPAGHRVSGSSELDLTTRLDRCGVLDGSRHTAIHAYYHFTADQLDASIDGCDVTVVTPVPGWRTGEGFNASRHYSTLPNLAAGSAQGLHQLIAGGAGIRYPVAVDAGLSVADQFPSVVPSYSVPSDVVRLGSQFSIQTYYYSPGDHARIVVSFDNDMNPGNDEEQVLENQGCKAIGSISANVQQSTLLGTAALSTPALTGPVIAAPIRCFVRVAAARLADQSISRVDYLHHPISIEPAPVVNGQCGAAAGMALAAAPTAAGLCLAGVASVVTGSGPWTWTCVGTNGGTTASCSAPVLSSPNGMLTFTAAAASVAEGAASNVVLSVSRTGGSTGAISVPWSTASGTAVIGSDYGTSGSGTQRSGTLTWAAGDTASKNITVGLAGANIPVLNDTLIETDETFTVSLGSPTGGALLGATTTATVTITDNDGVTLELTPATRSITEGATAAFTISRTGSTTSAFTVPWSIVHGSTSAADVGTSSGTLSFAAGATSVALNVTTVNDTLIEGPETFQVVLGTPSLAGVVIANGTGTVTMTDNDSLVAVGAATATTAENGGTLQLPVTRSGSLGTAASVAWSATNGTAKAGTDFGSSGVTTLSGSLSLPANAASANIAIPILNNAAITGVRDFTVTLNTATGATLDAGNKTVAVTITEDDKGIAMAAAAASVAESAGSVTVTVNRLGPPSGAVSATWTTANGTALAGTHFGNGGSTTQLSGTLNWPDGDGAAKSIIVPVLNDGAVNANRTFGVTLNSATGATLGTTKTTTVTIADDDNTLQFSAATATVAESTATLNLSVTRTGGTAGAASVVWATANGTAAAGSDFGTQGNPTALSGTLNWAAGDAAAKTISIPIINNTALSGGSRVFSVLLSDPGGATIGANAGVQVTITDDEKGVAFANTTYDVTEGTASIVLSVNRIGPATLALAVPWSTANGTALAGTQFGTSGSTAQRSGTLSWAAGDATAKNITIPIISNTVSHGDTAFTVAIGTMPAGFIKGEPNVATVTVHDDDLPPESLVRWSAAKYAVTEGAGANAQLTLTREVCSGGNCVPTLNRQVTVKYSTTAGTALATSDFTAATNAVVTFAPFETTKFVTIPITNNATAEAAEAFTVTLSAPSPALQLGNPSVATVAILDDDEVFPQQGLFPEGWGIPDQAPGVPGIGWHVATDAGAAEGFHTLKTDTVFDGETAAVEIPSRNYAAGNVTFKYRVSSEANFDFLRFYVDGVKVGEWSGTANETTWGTASFPLSAGNHVLRWAYEKDGSVSFGMDTAWIDAVVLPAVSP